MVRSRSGSGTATQISVVTGSKCWFPVLFCSRAKRSKLSEAESLFWPAVLRRRSLKSRLVKMTWSQMRSDFWYFTNSNDARKFARDLTSRF